MDEELSTIELTVLNETNLALEKLSETLGLSKGQVVDRLANEMSTKNPELAALLAAEQIAFITKAQTNEQTVSTLKHIVYFCIGAFTKSRDNYDYKKFCNVFEEFIRSLE